MGCNLKAAPVPWSRPQPPIAAFFSSVMCRNYLGAKMSFNNKKKTAKLTRRKREMESNKEWFLVMNVLLIFIRCLASLVFTVSRISNSGRGFFFVHWKLHHKRVRGKHVACKCNWIVQCLLFFFLNLFISVSCIIYRNGRALASKSYLSFAHSLACTHKAHPPLPKWKQKPNDGRERGKRENVGMKVRWKMWRTPNATLVAAR